MWFQNIHWHRGKQLIHWKKHWNIFYPIFLLSKHIGNIPFYSGIDSSWWHNGLDSIYRTRVRGYEQNVPIQQKDVSITIIHDKTRIRILFHLDDICDNNNIYFRVTMEFDEFDITTTSRTTMLKRVS